MPGFYLDFERIQPEKQGCAWPESKLLKVLISARILESCQCWLTEKVVFWKLSLRCGLSSKFCKSLLVLEVSPENVCGKALQLFYSHHRRVLERWKKQMVLECPPVVTTLSHFGPLKQGSAGWGPNCWKKRLQRAFLLFRKTNWQVRLKPKM